MTAHTGSLTHHDLPGICTHGPAPVPGLHPYDTDPLTAGELRATVADQQGTTFCLHFHSTRTILTGDDVIHWLDSTTNDAAEPVFANIVHRVPADTPQRPEDLWLVTVDPDTGTVSADESGPDHTIWDRVDDDNADGPAPITSAARHLARQVITDRAADRDLSNHRALTAAIPEIESAAANMLRTPGQPLLRGYISEALDRSYNRARMTQAGIDIHQDDLHHLRSYNHFHHLGFPPPSHQDMADYIIRRHGRRITDHIRRIARRMLRRPDSPLQGQHPGTDNVSAD